MFYKNWYKYFQFIKHNKIKKFPSNILNLIRYYCNLHYIGTCSNHKHIYYPVKNIPTKRGICLICKKELSYERVKK